MADPVVVEVEFFQKNERWFGYRFNIKKVDEVRKVEQELNLQVYGANQADAERRLHEELRHHYGQFGYSINVTKSVSWKGIGTDACHDTPTR